MGYTKENIENIVNLYKEACELVEENNNRFKSFQDSNDIFLGVYLDKYDLSKVLDKIRENFWAKVLVDNYIYLLASSKDIEEIKGFIEKGNHKSTKPNFDLEEITKFLQEYNLENRLSSLFYDFGNVFFNKYINGKVSTNFDVKLKVRTCTGFSIDKNRPYFDFYYTYFFSRLNKVMDYLKGFSESEIKIAEDKFEICGYIDLRDTMKEFGKWYNFKYFNLKAFKNGYTEVKFHDSKDLDLFKDRCKDAMFAKRL